MSEAAAPELLIAGKVVTSKGVFAPGWVATVRGEITGVGEGRPVGPARDLGDAVLVPGFVDAHVHGGGGHGYPDADSHHSAGAGRGGDRTAGGPSGAESTALAARDAHLAHGTTSSMASLVSAPPAPLLERVRTLSGLVERGELRGIHLEGPWLAPGRKGAHDPTALRAPEAKEIDELLAAGGGTIRMVTIAPELPGALEAIGRLVDAGLVVAIGHTDADYETTKRAIDAGATVATHLFNAMPPLLHREPGPVLALLEDERVTLELVADGVHLRPELVDWVERSAGADRVMYVTDAMGAAACGDGRYRLGVLDVDVEAGVATLLGTETIAGSTATMDALFRRRAIVAPDRTAANEAGASDAALVAAAKLTATNPARAMGWNEVGDIAVGKRADLVVLDRALAVREVIRAGRTIESAAARAR